jgi:O-antigen/teichoic acid export membrane protein
MDEAALTDASGRNIVVYAFLRAATFALLVGGGLVLAALLGVEQYGVYAQGAAFAAVVATISLFGQEQLLLNGTLDFRGLRLRATVVGVTATGLSSIAASVLLPGNSRVVAVSLCVAAGATVVASPYWLFAQANGKDNHRGFLELIQRVVVSATCVVPAAFHGGALGAAAASAVVAVAFTAPLWRTNAERLPTPAPFREGLLYGMAGLLYGATPTLISLVFAITASPHVNGNVRLVLLGYTGVGSITVAINNEFFRRRLYIAVGATRQRVVRRMAATDTIFAAMTCLSLPTAALFILRPFLSSFEDALEGIALLSLVVPFHVLSCALGNLIVVNKRADLAITRHLIASVSGIVAVLVAPHTVSGAVAALGTAEAAGCVFYLACSSAWRARSGPTAEEASKLGTQSSHGRSSCESPSSAPMPLGRESHMPEASSSSTGLDRSASAA